MLVFWSAVCIFSVWLGVEYSLRSLPTVSILSALSALSLSLCGCTPRAQALTYLLLLLALSGIGRKRQKSK